MALAELEFIDRAETVHFLGPSAESFQARVKAIWQPHSGLLRSRLAKASTGRHWHN